MVQLKSFALAFAAFSLGVQAGPCKVCSPSNIIQDGDFEGSSAPWTFDSGVSVETDTRGSDYAVSGTHYVNFDIANREDSQRYGISQQLTGLRPNQQYTLQFTWELTNGDGIYDGGIDVQTSLDGAVVDYLSFGKQDLDQPTVHTVTVTPTSSDPVLRISCGGSGDYYYGATVVMDDISMGMLCVSG